MLLPVIAYNSGSIPCRSLITVSMSLVAPYCRGRMIVPSGGATDENVPTVLLFNGPPGVPGISGSVSVAGMVGVPGIGAGRGMR